MTENKLKYIRKVYSCDNSNMHVVNRVSIPTKVKRVYAKCSNLSSAMYKLEVILQIPIYSLSESYQCNTILFSILQWIESVCLLFPRACYLTLYITSGSEPCKFFKLIIASETIPRWTM